MGDIKLAVGVDVVARDFNSGEGRVVEYDESRAEPWRVRWDKTGAYGWTTSWMLDVVGPGVS